MKRRFLLGTMLLSVGGAMSLPARAQSEKVYGKPYEAVWRAALESATASGLEVLSEDRKKGLIVGRGGVSAFGWGESVTINVAREGARSTRVAVANKRALATNILGPNWERRILDELDQRLATR